MPHKHKPILKDHAFEGITNLYSNPDGLMYNPTAESVVAAAITKREVKARRANLRYGMPQNGRHVKVVHYKDSNGNPAKRIITVGSTVECTERDLDSDKTMAFQLDTGELQTIQEVKDMGYSASGYLQSQKKYYREIQEIDDMVKNASS